MLCPNTAILFLQVFSPMAFKYHKTYCYFPYSV